MDYVELLMNYVIEDIGEIIEEYIGPYCTICGRTFIKDFNVRMVHEDKYEYYECVDKTKCINLEVKTKINPWSSTRGT